MSMWRNSSSILQLKYYIVHVLGQKEKYMVKVVSFIKIAFLLFL